MRVNISKSKFFAEKIEYLLYWITRQGIQPIRNKVEDTLNIKVPLDVSKSKFFAEQVEYLGYWITRQGIQPIRKKVEMNAILNIKAR
jgi:hypothetical protein